MWLSEGMEGVGGGGKTEGWKSWDRWTLDLLRKVSGCLNIWRGERDSE